MPRGRFLPWFEVGSETVSAIRCHWVSNIRKRAGDICAAAVRRDVVVILEIVVRVGNDHSCIRVNDPALKSDRADESRLPEIGVAKAHIKVRNRMFTNGCRSASNSRGLRGHENATRWRGILIIDRLDTIPALNLRWR